MPLKLLGILLLISGTTGFACNLCREQRNCLVLLKEIRYLYHLLQSEIRYTGLPIPEMLLSVSEKLSPPISDILQSIGKSGDWEKGKSFGQIWRENMELGLMGQSITRESRKLLMSFPESMGPMEREGQAKVLERHIEEMNRWIDRMEQEGKNKQKVIVSFGIGVGTFLSIILL